METFNLHLINHSGLDLTNVSIEPFITTSSSVLANPLLNNAEVDISINYESPKDSWAAFASIGFTFESSVYPRPLVLYVFQPSKGSNELRSLSNMVDASNVCVAKVISVTKNPNTSLDSLIYSNIVIELLPVLGVTILEE